MASASPENDSEFLDRITVNYLRHELTSYEAELAGLYGLIGRVGRRSSSENVCSMVSPTVIRGSWTSAAPSEAS